MIMQQIIINAKGTEKRMALLADETLVECIYHRPDNRPVTGAIYKGRVQKVLPGMQAVFVDIGTGKNGLLHKDELPAVQHLKREEREKISISSLIKEGESILVQVVKEETGEKGAKLTSLLSFTGHLLVYFPLTPHVGVSKKISEQNRSILHEWGIKHTDNTEGLVIRTGCENFPEKEMNLELKRLRESYQHLLQTLSDKKAPSLIKSPPFYQLYFEKWLNEKVSQVIVDDHETFLSLKKFVDIHKYPYDVSLYYDKESIFQKYGLDIEIQKAISPHVWLKNGSSLYFNSTEAMTVIDVNTGKHTGKKSREKTVLETNVLAAKEIMKQIRLRNLAGMITVDFITMQSQSAQEQIKKLILDEAKNDSVTIVVYGFTKMGLFEFTRKKERPSLLETLTEQPVSDIMDGRRRSSTTLYFELERKAAEIDSLEHEAAWFEVPNYLDGWLKKHSDFLKNIEAKCGLKLLITSSESEKKITLRQTGSELELLQRINKDTH